MTELSGDYSTKQYDTLGLKENLEVMLDDLYSRTAPEIHSVIGVPYELTGHGTISYPFMVLEHSDGKINVLLVGSHTGGGDEACGGDADSDADSDADTDADADADSDSDGDSGCTAASSHDFLPAVALLTLAALLMHGPRRRRD